MHDDYGSRGNSSDYSDTGCEFSPRCSDCPLEECLESIPRGKQQMRLQLRAEAMQKMRHSGIGVQDVARAFGVSTRTVQREMNRRRRIKKKIPSSKYQIPNNK